MAALHEALKALGPTDFSETPIDDLKPFLSSAFTSGQLIVDSVPIAAPAEDATGSEGRSRAVSNASSASEIEVSPARSEPPPSDVLALQKEWKGDHVKWLNITESGGITDKGANGSFPLWKVCVILALLMLAAETYLLAREKKVVVA